MITITAVGGYGEVGRNCTLLQVDGVGIILDMGLHLDHYIEYTNDEDLTFLDPAELTKVGAVPDIKQIDKRNVRAIIPTHAHLDHIGAIPFLERQFNAPIICTPYTGAVIRAICKNEKIPLRNKIRVLNINAHLRLTEDIHVEFINVTHSTPQTVAVAIHTKYGAVVYANDFKLDNHPVIGKKPNYERLQQLGKEGVLALMIDSLYAAEEKKCPSETVAKDMLNDVLLGIQNTGKVIIVTTFSSHIARLKSIIELGRQLNRRVVLLGRSLAKYVFAAQDVQLVNFSSQAKLVPYSKQVKRILQDIERKGKEKYMIVCTGHQGEPKAVLAKMVDGVYPFKLGYEDSVIFSCAVIPSPINIKNRRILEEKLKAKGVRIFKDIHVSGHAAREDHHEMINMLRPRHIIPAHCTPEMAKAMASLAREMGYDHKNIHMIVNQDTISLKA
ncbi:MAG TPA: RNase J family beta-CASP ribonuclease [Candidatus Nanoarchaeia archaeon]|nr:RNase J family beta-CASP ribonuclease [Candidatus Nanoarchaeia archaeon]